ncbi:MAG: heavy metal-binding domain-containing protein, partial [bacterium]|nr:heavy metal-binding domain-containing protein [bacterium]
MVTKDYTCPMHPDVQRAQPGLCPQCGMQLVPTAKKTDQPAGAEHKRHEHGHHSKNIFRTRFWVSLVLTIPVLALSDFFSALLPARLVDFPGSAYVPAVLTTIIFFYGGGIFITSAYRELRARLPGMMTLIALATSVAYVYSLVVIATGKTNTLFWELATLITVMLLGHWMEMRAVSSAQRALSALSKLLPDTAEVQRDGVSVVLPIKEIQRDDIVLVKPGGTVPVDGVVTEGLSEVDESLLSGETSPVAKAAGDQCIAGSLNGDGALSIRVTKIGSETFLAGIQKLVAQAQASKSRLQLLSDRAALYLTGIAIVTGGATLVTWLLIA